MRDVSFITYDAGTPGPEYTATEDRVTDSGLYVADSNGIAYTGVRGGAVSNVGTAVTIAPLTAVVQTTSVLGAYRGAFPAGSAELAKTITPAHVSQVRIDALDIKIFDHEADGSNNRGIDIQLTAGTPGGSAPAFTGVGVRLGTFSVPASGGGTPTFTANANLLGYAAAGGVLAFTNRPSNPTNGLEIFNRSTGAREIYITGSGWRTAYGGKWNTWVPSWTGSSANPQRGNGLEEGWWRLSDGMVDAYWKYQWNTIFNVGVGTYAFTLPTPIIAAMANSHIGGAQFHDDSAGVDYARHAVVVGNTGSFAVHTEAGARWSASSPVQPAQNDIIEITLRYRPATEFA